MGELDAFVDAFPYKPVLSLHFNPMIIQANQDVGKIIRVIFGTNFKMLATIASNISRKLVFNRSCENMDL